MDFRVVGFLFCYMKAYISWEFLGIFFMPSFFIYYSPVILFYTSMYKLYYHTHRYIQYMQHNYYIFKTAIQTKSVIWYIKFSLFNVWKCIILSIIKIWLGTFVKLWFSKKWNMVCQNCIHSFIHSFHHKNRKCYIFKTKTFLRMVHYLMCEYFNVFVVVVTTTTIIIIIIVVVVVVIIVIINLPII